jgi:hypothetical protein
MLDLRAEGGAGENQRCKFFRAALVKLCNFEISDLSEYINAQYAKNCISQRGVGERTPTYACRRVADSRAGKSLEADGWPTLSPDVGEGWGLKRFMQCASAPGGRCSVRWVAHPFARCWRRVGALNAYAMRVSSRRKMLCPMGGPPFRPMLAKGGALNALCNARQLQAEDALSDGWPTLSPDVGEGWGP